MLSPENGCSAPSIPEMAPVASSHPSVKSHDWSTFIPKASVFIAADFSVTFYLIGSFLPHPLSDHCCWTSLFHGLSPLL